MKLKSYMFFVLFYLFTILIFGQKQTQENNFKNLKFKNLSLKQGLSQSSVLSILQDKNGYLWFGTRDGLNKYDGNKFIQYRHNTQDSTSISHNSVKSLYEDLDGNIWIGTINGLNKYIAKTNSFKNYYFNRDKIFLNNEIWTIVQEDQDHLWIGTSNGLKKINTKDGFFVTLTNSENQDGLFYNPTRALLKTKNNNLWIKNTENIGVYNTKTKKTKHYAYPENTSKELNKNTQSILYLDKENNIWLGFKNGLAVFNRDLDVFEFFKTQINNSIIDDEVRSICEDNLGNLWVGTYKGLYIVNKDKSVVSHIVHDKNNPNSLSQNSIYDIIEDSKGDIWIGTYAGGVNYYDRGYDQFQHFTSGTNNSKLNYKVVGAIVEDPDQNLWIATEGGGINFYNKKTGKFTYYTHNPNNSNSLSSNNVKAMIRDYEGNFWIGTHNGGLNFLNPKKQPFVFKKYVNNPDDNQSLSNNRVISLLEDIKHNIWIGTSGGGLNVLNTQTNFITQIKDSLHVVGGIIYSISNPLNNGNLLIGGESGLAKLNIESKDWTPIAYRGKENNNVASRAVLCTYIDKKNNLWVGTEGDGIYCYDEKSKKSTKYGIAQGLPNDVVYGILPDDNGNIWLSTNNGLSRLNLETQQFKNFNNADGLQSNEFNFGAYLKNTNGKLLFGGANGFNIFNPNKIIENSFVPPLSITSFKVNNKPFLNVTDSLNNITLKHNQNDFNFDFVALSYSQPEKNQYAYKLEGFDRDWNYIDNKKSANYTNLDAGKYVFKVKASNNHGVWNEEGVSIPIIILAAPWKTWWAYLIYTILFLSLMFAIRKLSLQRIHVRNELKQERLEKERNEEVNKLKLQLFTNISHDFRTPLTLIMGPLEQIIKANEGNEFIKSQHQTMHRNANVLMQLINQLLDFRKSESGKLALHASENDIVAFTKEIKYSFEHLAKNKNIEFTLSTTKKSINIWFDRIMLKKILYNLLSNAFKFTPNNGKIRIEIDVVTKKVKSMPNGYVRFKVSDSGKGIPEKNMAYIFDRFYQVGERSGTGIGLTLTKSLVKLHKGRITVKSSKKNGTFFIVKLPLGKTHLSQDQISKMDDSIKENGLYNFEGSTFINTIAPEHRTDKVFDKSLPSILIVEDNLEVRTFLKNLFNKTYNVYEAADGKKGLEVAKTSDIDLILSDVMMPIMDGIEFCNEIKTNIRTSHIPVILLTARTSEEYRNTGYKTGADAYITKPFDSNVLKIRVNNLLVSRKNLIEKFKKDIFLQPKEVTVTSADEEFLQQAIDIVENNMTNPEFTIKDFIDKIGMSRSVLYRKLKALTDQSISEFIRTLKLKRAAQLLKQSQMNVSEIAFELGFKDLKYFRESFKSLFKMTPSNYRGKK